MPGHEQPEILLAKLEMTRDYYSVLMRSLLDPAVIHYPPVRRAHTICTHYLYIVTAFAF